MGKKKKPDPSAPQVGLAWDLQCIVRNGSPVARAFAMEQGWHDMQF